MNVGYLAWSRQQDLLLQTGHSGKTAPGPEALFATQSGFSNDQIQFLKLADRWWQHL
jgi:hypothetical protein